MAQYTSNQQRGAARPVSSSAGDTSPDLSSPHAPKHAEAADRSDLRTEHLAELARLQQQRITLDQRLKFIDRAENATSFMRDASLVVGSGIATVVAGPAGGAAFRTGVGALSHGAETAVAASLGGFNRETLAHQLKADVVEGSVAFVGGTASICGANLAMQAAGRRALSETTTKVLGAEVTALSGATVQNAHALGEKLSGAESLSERDVRQAALTYLAAGITAGVSTKVPSDKTLSLAHGADLITTTGVAAGQQYALDGTVALDSNLLAGLQNATMSAALAKRAFATYRPVAEAAEADRVKPSPLKISGIPHENVRSSHQYEALRWRDKSADWSPLQQWLVEEAERRSVETAVVNTKGSGASPAAVHVEIGSCYGSGEMAFTLARREMYLKVGELSTGKRFDLTTPAAVYLHRLCEELAVNTPHLERARHEMLRAHGRELVQMGLGDLHCKTDGDLRSMIKELRRIGHSEQADYYKESLRRSGIEVEHEHANKQVKIPVYGLADPATVNSLRQALAEWRNRSESWTPLQKWVMTNAELHGVEVMVIPRGSHAYDGTRVGVALDDLRPSHGAFETARHELWHAVSVREFFDKVDPKRLDRKHPAPLYLDELLAHMAANRPIEEAHRHVMHNYGPSFEKMNWPARYNERGGDLTRILDEVGRSAGSEYKNFYQIAPKMANVAPES
jgi:hypothetical protein